MLSHGVVKGMRSPTEIELAEVADDIGVQTHALEEAHHLALGLV